MNLRRGARFVRRLRTFDVAADALAKLAVFVGILFSALTYWHSLNSEKVERVTDYIERYEIGDTSKSVRVVSQALRAFTERSDYRLLAQQSRTNGTMSAAANEALWRMLVYEGETSPDLSNDLDSIVGFYSSLQTCIAAAICDHKVAHAFFDQPAATFLDNFGGYIAYRQGTATGFASGLQRFHAEAARAPPT